LSPLHFNFIGDLPGSLPTRTLLVASDADYCAATAELRRDFAAAYDAFWIRQSHHFTWLRAFVEHCGIGLSRPVAFAKTTAKDQLAARWSLPVPVWLTDELILAENLLDRNLPPGHHEQIASVLLAPVIKPISLISPKFPRTQAGLLAEQASAPALGAALAGSAVIKAAWENTLAAWIVPDQTSWVIGFCERLRTNARQLWCDLTVWRLLQKYPAEALEFALDPAAVIRAFLGYDLTEHTPDHSSLSVIRTRLGEATYDEAFMLILRALQTHGLVKGHQARIDASVIEANASLRSLVNRQTEEACWDYVRRLAAENGIEPKDTAAVRQFDRKRPKKMSNQEWVNPHDPDAKIGPTKAGATDMIYKPEHTVDLDTGAILLAEVRLGHEPDQQDLARHVVEAQENINAVQALPPGTLTLKSATADKGYHAVPEMGDLQAEGIRTVISDPVKHRKMAKLKPAARQVVRNAKRSAQSNSGKDLLRRRGMHIERTFAHILDAGGARRTTLRGLVNLNKRFKLAAATYNLSQLMRKLFGVGTPKQWAAGANALFYWFWRLWLVVWAGTVGRKATSSASFNLPWRNPGLQLRWPIVDMASPVFQ